MANTGVGSSVGPELQGTAWHQVVELQCGSQFPCLKHRAGPASVVCTATGTLSGLGLHWFSLLLKKSCYRKRLSVKFNISHHQNSRGFVVLVVLF